MYGDLKLGDVRQGINIIIERATISDADKILSLQKLAYKSEADIYNNYKILPMIQSEEEIKKDFLKWAFLKVTFDEKIIGSVKAREKDGTCYIGRLIVDPDYQNRGIGTKLLLHIETIFGAKRFELFTGDKSQKNLYLYKKLGYKIFKKERIDNIDFVYLEKLCGV